VQCTDGRGNDGRENVWAGKTMGGKMTGVENRLEGICPGCKK